MSTTLRPGLPPTPERIARLPVDARGFPVPFFVAWVDGAPDHRYVDPDKLARCVKQRVCWVCGQPLGRWLTFTLGPMCVVTRTTSEPPAHLECAQYSTRACPFLSRPHAHRREAGAPENTHEPAGAMLTRNPGVQAIWTCRDYERFRAYHGQAGTLIHVGEPHAVTWVAEGRPATWDEVRASIASGMPALVDMANSTPLERDRKRELQALHEYVIRALGILRAQFPEAESATVGALGFA